MDSIREGVKKPWAKIVIFAIVISFVGAGYFTSSLFLGDPFAAAVVNGESISTQDFQRAYSRTRQQYGEAFSQFVKTPEQEQNFKENVLQNLISRTVTLQASQALGMRVSNNEIRKALHEIPALQSDGVYSSELLDQALTRIGMTRGQFKNSMVMDSILAQLTNGVTATEFVLESELVEQHKLLGQLRTGKVLPIKYTLFDNQIEITEEDIASYYQGNIESYRLDEAVSLDYIELSITSLQNEINPSDEKIEEYYNDNLDRFQSDEQRRVSHILIAGDDDEALSKATEIKSQLDGGADFIALVKSDSSDEFSAENDGDLGVIAAGDMEQPFEDAMNQLVNIGNVSEPVKTSFGYHIIKLTELSEGVTQALEEVKDQIIPALKKQDAEELYYAKSQLLEEKSFEISDSLKEVSELTSLPIKTSPVFSSRTASGIFANQEVKNAAFSENVLVARMNSNVININDNHVVVLRLNTHEPSKIQSMEEVKETVTSRLRTSKAKQQAVAYGKALMDDLAQKNDVQSKLQAMQLAWKDLDKISRSGTELPYLQLQEFFKIPAPLNGEVTIDSMEDANEIVLFILNQIEDGVFSNAEKSVADQVKQRLNGFYGNANYSSLIEQERSKAEVTRNLDNINR